MNIEDFLKQHNYRDWKQDKHEYGVTTHYQKGIDTVPEYEHYPLCECNDKLFINIVHSEFTINGHEHNSFEMNLVHENKAGDWADIRIYSLTEDKIVANISKYEVQLLEMWALFHTMGGEE